ncbi:MAG: hypothetical protein WCS43_16745, partial [Verrucomicrobiota bacterium]
LKHRRCARTADDPEIGQDLQNVHGLGFAVGMGNVAAVLTEKYWDAQLGELAARSEQVKSMSKKLAKEGKLSAGEQKAALEKFSAQLFTPKEREILEKGKSNQAYHYLGSSKIMAQIGKGFAEAMVELMKQPGEPAKGGTDAQRR